MDSKDNSLAFAAFAAAAHSSYPLAVIQVSPQGLPLEFLLCFHGNWCLFSLSFAIVIHRSAEIRVGLKDNTSVLGCSKLTTSLVNISLKFLTYISQIFQYFGRKNLRSFCTAKTFSVFGYKVVKHLTSWPLNELFKLPMLWTTGPRYFRKNVCCDASLEKREQNGSYEGLRHIF